MNLVLDTLRSRLSIRWLGHLTGLVLAALALKFSRFDASPWPGFLGLAAALGLFEVLAALADAKQRRLKALAPDAFPFKNLSAEDRDFLQAALQRMPRFALVRSAACWSLAALSMLVFMPHQSTSLAAAAVLGMPVSCALQYYLNRLMVRRVHPFFFYVEDFSGNLGKRGTSVYLQWIVYSIAPLSLLLLAKLGSLGAFDLVILFGASIIVLVGGHFFSRILLEPAGHLRDALKRFEKGDYGALLDVMSGDEIGQATEAYNKAVRATDRRFFIQETFGFMIPREKSPQVFEDGLKLDGEEREVAVLCARINGATLPAFNKFCQLVMEHALKEGGGLDEAGEGMIVVVFGAPFKAEKPGLAAARVAARLKDALPVFRTQQKMQAGVAVTVSLAVAEGKAMAGLAGPKGMQRYTVLGEPARLAREMALKDGVFLRVEGLGAEFEVDGEGRLLRGPAVESPDISKGIAGLGFQPGERL